MSRFQTVLVTLSTLVATSFAADLRPFNTWNQYLGGADSSQYSSLNQINKSNVKQLTVAWSYPTGDNIQYLFNPFIVDGVMYVQAKNNALVALDAASGRELWVHAFQGPVTTRGMKEPEMKQIAHWIAEVLGHLEDESVAKRVRTQVEALTEKFPLYENRRTYTAQ